MSNPITTQPTPSAPPTYTEAVSEKVVEQQPFYKSKPASWAPEARYTPALAAQPGEIQLETAQVQPDDTCCCDPYYNPDSNNCLVCLFCNIFCRPFTACYSMCRNDCEQPSNVRRQYNSDNNSYIVDTAPVDSGYGGGACLCCDDWDWGCGDCACEEDECGDCGGCDGGDWSGGDDGGDWGGGDDGGDDGGGCDAGDDEGGWGGGDDGGGWGGGDDCGGGDYDGGGGSDD